MAAQARDIAEARRFYQAVLGCGDCRSDVQRLDFNLYGHRFACHLDPQLGRQGRTTSHYDPVVGKFLPVSHCGIVLEKKERSALPERLMQHKVAFGPSVCVKSAPGEQATLYLMAWIREEIAQIEKGAQAVITAQADGEGQVATALRALQAKHSPSDHLPDLHDEYNLAGEVLSCALEAALPVGGALRKTVEAILAARLAREVEIRGEFALAGRE
jgi:uncharacterized protein